MRRKPGSTKKYRDRSCIWERCFANRAEEHTDLYKAVALLDRFYFGHKALVYVAAASVEDLMLLVADLIG